MQDLTVVSVENNTLVLQDESGITYRLGIDETLHGRIGRAIAGSASDVRVSPREVQQHIRAGMTAEEVATLLGATVASIERYVGPVLAEREHIVATAQNVEVHVAPATHGEDVATTFGAVIKDRLAALAVEDERWASWKDPEQGWIVKLSFTAKTIDHDARWQFDPKRAHLTPLNTDATTLSQKGEISEGLIPRLRVVSPVEPTVDVNRFDSAAFDVVLASESQEDGAFPSAPDDDANSTATVSRVKPLSTTGHFGTGPLAAINRFDQAPTERDHSHTADLLESLRKRRGERSTSVTPSEPAPSRDDEAVSDEGAPPAAESKPRSIWDAAARLTPSRPRSDGAKAGESESSSTGSAPAPTAPAAKPRDSQEIELPAFDSMLAEAETRVNAMPDTNAPLTTTEVEGLSDTGVVKAKAARGKRTAMPSWDDIVFGAKGDD